MPNMDTILLSELKILRWSAGGGRSGAETCFGIERRKKGYPYFSSQSSMSYIMWSVSVKPPNCHFWVEPSRYIRLSPKRTRTSTGRYQEMKGMFGTGLGAPWVPSGWLVSLVH